MNTGESSKSVVTINNATGRGSNNNVSGNKERTQGQPERVSYKMNLDNVIEKLELPFRKFQENYYLVAMSTKEEIEKAVAKIQTLTKVTWSVKQTRKFDNKKKSITMFKRTYGCHMSTRCRSRTKKVRNKKSRNIDCPAQLLVTVRRYVSRTRSKIRGSLLDKKYPCALEFRNHHNHKIDAVNVLTTRPLGEEIKQNVLKLLNKGHSCASAYHTLYTIKVEEFGTDYKTKMGDRYNFPKRNDISSLWKSHNFKDKTELNADFSYTLKNLEEILNSYQKNNGTLYKIMVINNNIVVCICTPLMQRSIQQVSEIIFIEPSVEEIKEYKTYFILTQASVGALPIACILTNSHNISAFSDGMRLFFQMIQIRPTMILTSTEIMNELIVQKFFPNSKIMYSFYHILGSAWRLLHESRHEIVRTKKESFYQLFREVVFADTEEGLVVARQVLAVECAKQKFLDYVDKMYEHISLWCLYYRQYIVLRGVDTFNYNEAETSFRLFRLISKIPLDRTKLFNLTQITDYMCSAFEKYYKNRLVEMVLNKPSIVLQEKYNRPSINVHMEDIGHHQYLFKRAAHEMLDEYYQVDMITNLCTCAMGIMGKHCDHIAEVLLRCNILVPPITIEQKAAYYFVATGVLKHKNSFLPDHELDFGNEFRIVCCSPETILGPEYEATENASERPNTSKPTPNLESTINKWLSYSNKVVKLMEKDPAKFLPAVNAHMENIQKYSTSVPMLLKGLYAGFPYKGDAEKLPPLTIISSRIAPAKNNEPPPLIKSSCTITRESVPSVVVNVKQESVESMQVNLEPPPLTRAIKRREPIPSSSSVKFKRKKEPPMEFVECHSPWNNFSGESSSPQPMDEEQYSDEDSKQKITILDEKAGVLVERRTEVDQKKSLTFHQLSNNDGCTLLSKNNSVQFEEMPRDEPDIFHLQKGIYMDHADLNQFTECEIAVLNEKKGILIIPMSPE